MRRGSLRRQRRVYYHLLEWRATMPVETKRTDTYPDGLVPDVDVEVCLKVLRTLRAECYGPGTEGFRPRAALILEHAHREVITLTELAQQKEEQDYADGE